MIEKFKRKFIQRNYGLNKKKRPYRNDINHMEYVWAMKDDGSDDWSGEMCSINTNNDIELVYWRDTSTYSIIVETIYWFHDKGGEIEYIQRLFSGYTKWMLSQNLSIDYELPIGEIFTEGQGISAHFDTIEETYANFRNIAEGYFLQGRFRGE